MCLLPCREGLPRVHAPVLLTLREEKEKTDKANWCAFQTRQFYRPDMQISKKLGQSEKLRWVGLKNESIGQNIETGEI